MNAKICQIVQYLGLKKGTFVANPVSTNEKSTTKNISYNFQNNLTSNLRYNQFKVEWYYLPSLMRYLDYWNVGYTAKVSGLWYVLTVDPQEVDYVLHFYLHVKGGAK
jgi:hypothetical protein